MAKRSKCPWLCCSFEIISVPWFSFPPRKKDDITVAVVSWISEQIDVSPRAFEKYLWKGRLWDMHLASIRNYTGFRPSGMEDFQSLAKWLLENVHSHPSRSKMYAASIRRYTACNQAYYCFYVTNAKPSIPILTTKQLFDSSPIESRAESCCDFVMFKCKQL